MRPWLSLGFAACAGVAQAQDDGSSFVEANILSIFYHELGHALIDVEALPIYGQEEDAADVFAIYAIDALYNDDAARSLAHESGFGFIGEAEARNSAQDEVAWWDTHGADEQRYYNMVCIFYGSDPDARADFADEMALPEERAETCAEEYEQAAYSWGNTLAELFDRGAGKTLVFDGDDSTASKVLGAEIDWLNSEMSLAKPVTVRIESCGEANAFYDPETIEIIFCSEFEDHLIHLEGLL